MYHKSKTPGKILSSVRRLRKNQTPQEVILWSRLRAGRFCNLKWRRQYSMGKYIVDFICLDKKLIVELDGWQHKKEDQRRYDLERTRFLESRGFVVSRFWNNEINTQLESVLARIGEFCGNC